MAAILTGNTLGISNANQVSGGMQGNAPAVGRSGENLYVNVVNGNLVVQRQDELLASRGTDIGVLRTYNSQGQFDGDNNDNWRIGFYRQLGNLSGAINAAGSSISRTQEDGAAQNFSWNGSAYVSTDGDGAHDTLSYNAGTGLWTWTDGSSRATETYDWNNGAGKLLLQADAAGNTISYSYNAAGLLTRVTSASSTATQFNYTDLSYDAAANLQSVTSSYWDAASSSNKTVSRVAYSHEAWSGGNRLKSVTVDLTPDITTDSKTYVTTYTYASSTSTLLSGLAQSDGTSLAFTYTADGKLAGIADALGQTTTYAYDTANARTSVTDALGNVTVYGYDAAGRIASVTAPAVGGASAVTSYAWDASGKLSSITDGEGKTSVMAYDANGNVVLQRDAAGNTVTRSYDANNQLIAETVYLTPDPDGDGAASASTPLTARYVYDAAGKSQLRFIVSAEGRVTRFDYDASGQRTATIQYRGNAYAGTSFGESDLLSWVAGADKTQSLRTDYSYDFRGQLASATTWGSVDAGGNGVAGTNATTSFVYSPNGQLLQTIGALGAALQTTTTTYDGLGRQLSFTNALNQTTSSVYDDAGRKTSVTAANGLTTVSTWDNAGRLIGTQQSGSGVAAQTGYFYDADKQLRMTRDALGNINWMLYDAAGRRVGDIDGNGSLTEYQYDGNDRVIRRIRYATVVNTALLTFNADGSPSAAALALTLDNLRPAASVDQATWNVYDAAGRLLKSVDASGAVSATSTRTTDYTYDLAGNRTKEITNIDSGTYQNETLVYDELGRLTSSTDMYGSSYARVDYLYDAMGNRMRQTATVNLSQQSATGATVKISYYGYDAMNRMRLVNGGSNNSIYNSSNLSSTTGRRVTYDANGNRIKEEDGSSTLVYGYDALNRLTIVTQGTSTRRVVKYDLADRVLESFDNTQPSETAAVHYTNLYDAQGHMLRQWHRAGSAASSDSTISTTSSWDESTSYYDYDSLGNITRTYTQRFGDHLFHTAYATTFTKIGDRYLRSQIVGKRTDNLGNPGYSSFTYDYNGYLTNFADSDASSNNRSYQSNASGQILRKSGSSVTAKIMMANGQQLGTYDSTGLIDFNVAYQAIDSIHPATGPGSYEINAGDTLQSIAFNTYGDRAMWYLIADANGLSSDAVLTPGMTLKLPSVVGSTHNNFQTFKPVDTASIIGVTDPTLSTPTSSSNTCKTVGIIIAAVVASIVVTVVATALTAATLGVLGVPAMSATGVVLSMIFAAAGGALASMASQGVMIAGGLQSGMNWGDVAAGAVEGALTARLGIGVARLAARVEKQSEQALSATRTALKAATESRVAAYVANGAQKGSDDALAALQKAKDMMAVAEKLELSKFTKAFGSSDYAQKVVGGMGKFKLKAAGFSLNRSIKLAESLGDTVISATGEIVSQGVDKAMGKRSDFDWNGVMLAGVTLGAPVTRASRGPLARAEKQVIEAHLLKKMIDREKFSLTTLEKNITGVRPSFNGGSGSGWKKMFGVRHAIAATDYVKNSRAGKAWDAFTQTEIGSVVEASATGFATGFALGMVRSSISQGLAMDSGYQSEFDTDSLLSYGVTTGIAGAVGKTVLESGLRTTKKTAAATDTVQYDFVRVAGNLLGNLSANWMMNGLYSEESVSNHDAIQRVALMDTNTLMYARLGLRARK